MPTRDDSGPRSTSSPHRCRFCGNKGILYVLVEYAEETSPRRSDDYWESWKLVRCPTCREVSLLRTRGTVHEVGAIRDAGDDPEALLSKIMYPTDTSRPKGIPVHIAVSLEAAERLRPIDVNGYAVLLGRVIEEVCRDRDASGRTLFEKLKSLEAKDELPARLVTVAHGFRRLRNVGAHADLGDLSDSEADLLADLCRAILGSIYTIPHLATLVEERAAALVRRAYGEAPFPQAASSLKSVTRPTRWQVARGTLYEDESRDWRH